MKKTLVTTVLACVMTIFGFAASAQSQQVVSLDGAVFTSNVSKNLKLFVATSSEVDLAKNLSALSGTDGKTLGYTRNGEFVSLAQAVKNAEVVPDGSAKTASIYLGKFEKGDKIQFGYQDASNEFHPYNTSNQLSSEPNYYGGYNPESFYQLDFSNDPFDGMIEIVIGEPLPAPAVTLIVALSAGALFLLYKNRRQRYIQIEQA